MPSLAQRRNDMTHRLILEAAVGMLGRGRVADLTVRAVAKWAEVSERTVFRYFPSRDVLLDAVADAVREKLALPPDPGSIAELLAAPRVLYEAFEPHASLIDSALHSEIFLRMRDTQAKKRWQTIRALVEDYAPRSADRDLKLAAANIRFYLAASSWYYFRFNFGFTLDETVACAEAAIRQALAALSTGSEPGTGGSA